MTDYNNSRQLVIIVVRYGGANSPTAFHIIWFSLLVGRLVGTGYVLGSIS